MITCVSAQKKISSGIKKIGENVNKLNKNRKKKCEAVRQAQHPKMLEYKKDKLNNSNIKNIRRKN